MELILLRWFDSALAPSSAVYDEEDIAHDSGLLILETVGWLVVEVDEPHGGHYAIAASKHGEKDLRGLQWIPKANVISKSTLILKRS